VRVAVSGTHGVGKSTLIAAFLSRHPEYAHEPEAFEVVGDDVDLAESGAPTPDGLHTLLEYTVSALRGRSTQARVVFDRSPADYLAYVAASSSAWRPGEMQEFLVEHVPLVRASISHLDLLAYLPLTATGEGERPGEDERFRRRVDLWMRRVLLDDVYELFPNSRPPRVVVLPPSADRQLDELSRLVQTTDA
jgi:hypothetical protein